MTRAEINNFSWVVLKNDWFKEKVYNKWMDYMTNYKHKSYDRRKETRTGDTYIMVVDK